MERPTLPPQPPNQSLARGYKFVWRLLLISNLALGAYIFTRPRKKDILNKDSKATNKVPPAPIEIKPTPEFEGSAISTQISESEKMRNPIPENQWAKPFKW